MPFKSEKQRRFLHANHPEVAKDWEEKYENEEKLPAEVDSDFIPKGPDIKKRVKDLDDKIKLIQKKSFKDYYNGK